MRQTLLIYVFGSSLLVACGDEQAHTMHDCEHYVRICTDCGNCDGTETCAVDETTGATMVGDVGGDASDWNNIMYCARKGCEFASEPVFDPTAPAPPTPCTREPWP